MRKLTRISIAAVAVSGIALGATSCMDDGKATPKATAKENKITNNNYSRLTSNQPAHTGDYSPTRATKNFWIDTWMKDPNKLSYIYIQNANGQYGYFILKGLPVTYGVSLVPPQQKTDIDTGEYGGQALVQAPSIDGTFSSNSNTNVLYGKDAVTGAYVEFSIGTNQSYFLYDQPLDLPQYKDAKPMGPSTIAQAEKLKQ